VSRIYSYLTVGLVLLLATWLVIYPALGHPLIEWARGRSGTVWILDKFIEGDGTGFSLSRYYQEGDWVFILLSLTLLFWLLLLWCTRWLVSQRSYTLFLCAIILLGGFLRLAIAWQNPLLLQAGLLQAGPMVDDSYYYFNIARNIAAGNGVRHDSFNVTTGFQPLYVFLTVPIFALIKDSARAINFVLTFETVLAMIYSLFLYKIVNLLTSPKIGLFIVALWALSPTFLYTDVNGLETSALLCATCIITYYYLLFFVVSNCPRIHHYAIFGIMVGIGFLTRVDLIFFLPAAVLDQAFRTLKKEEIKSFSLRLFCMIAACLIVSLPWLIYNLIMAGSIMPSSGQAMRFIALAHGFTLFPKATQATGKIYFPIEFPPVKFYWESILAGLVSLRMIFDRVFPLGMTFLILLTCTYLAPKTFIRRLSLITAFLIFLALLFFAYTCYIFATWFYMRYFAPIAIGYLILIGLMIRHISDLSPLRMRDALVKAGAAFIAPGVLSLFFFISIHMMHRITIREEPSGYYQMAMWINKQTNRDSIIGVFQSGIVGYYLDRKFYALDGVVNQHALDAMKKNEIDNYILENHMDYVMDWPTQLENLLVRCARDHDFLTHQELVYRGFFDVYRIRQKHHKR